MFPAFSLAISGGAVAGLTLRRGPEDVSESQREFIDLAFRMALMAVSADGGAATLIVDAPESSLDLIFAERAGQLLGLFGLKGTDPGNRVVVTSNLTNAGIIPALLQRVPIGTIPGERIINLLDLAAENAAAINYGDEYRQHLANILSHIDVNRNDDSRP